MSELGPVSLASPHTAALQIAWLLRTHSILGVTHRYPEALVKVDRVRRCDNRVRRQLNRFGAGRECPALRTPGAIR